ncbi:MAG: hypothetical protein ACI9C3_001217 [Yoonia sp.]|jgi:hypothetical protein
MRSQNLFQNGIPQPLKIMGLSHSEQRLGSAINLILQFTVKSPQSFRTTISTLVSDVDDINCIPTDGVED